MKQSIRAFAIGLFTAAIIMLIVNYFSNGSTKDLTEMPIEDVVDELKNEGYRVLTESEYISMSITGESEESKGDTESTKEEQADKAENTDTEKTEDTNKEKTTPESEDTSSEDGTASDEQEQEQPAAPAKSYTVTIESGMAPSTISNELEANGVIENSAEFIRYLEDEGYVARIQLGEFTITSDMSYFEVAEALTK